MSKTYWDEQFLDLVALSLTGTAMQEGRMLYDASVECAAGVVAMSDRFFFDPKRWKFKKKGVSYDASAPLVEIRCNDLNDVSDVVSYARAVLTPRRNTQQWREDIFEEGS